jgi:hypothetical protein
MVKQILFKEIQSRWDEYKQEFKTAGALSHSWAKDSDMFFMDHFELVFARVLLLLEHGSMQLWESYDENNPLESNYLCISHIQNCAYTKQKSLLLFAVTRITDIDEDTMTRMWAEAFQGTASFAIENGCTGLVAYTDLDYLVEKAKAFGPWKNIVKRNFIFFPLED